MPSRVEFARVAPRLERAHREERAARAAARAERSRQRERVLRAERLVAHRELQLARAYAKRSVKYMRQRERKLHQAREELADVVARAESIGAV